MNKKSNVNTASKLDTIKKVLDIARAYDLAYVELDGFKAHLREKKPAATVQKPLKEQIGLEFGNPTDDELLFASSPFPVTPEEIKRK